MRSQPHSFFPAVFLIVSLFALTGLSGAQQATLGLKIEDVMTAQELRDTGVSGLTPLQRKALNSWLNRYTEKAFKILMDEGSKKTAPERLTGRGDCAPAIETMIAGEFNGWEGETIFKLDNGQIWQQA
jgi:hypothetical protein